MGYIIIWRNSHKEPHIDLDVNGFKEEYNSFNQAKEAAEEIMCTENENCKSRFYFDYKIYKEVND